MRQIRAFIFFWYDFVVGDDWTMAAGVVLGLATTALIVHNRVTAWWVMPVVAGLAFTVSVWRAVHKTKR